MTKNKRNHPLNTFRKNKKSGHPTYAYHQRGNFYEYISITHNKEGNLPLNVNPEPGNKSKAYIKPNPERGRAEDLKEKLPNWEWDSTDITTVESVKKKPIKKKGK